MFAQNIIDDALKHALEVAPKESCGLAVQKGKRPVYVPCKNISAYADQFIIDPDDYANAEDSGEILGIVHSHYGVSPDPSPADLAGCEKSGLPWLIVNQPLGTHKSFAPSGYVAPLVGRQFVHGIFDCYSIIRDYYKLELGIELPDYVRDEHWWQRGENLYMENFQNAGFVEVPFETIQPHDGILMQCRSHITNHAAVYVGDSRILQHLEGRLSGHDVFGGYWQKSTTAIVRHRSLL